MAQDYAALLARKLPRAPSNYGVTKAMSSCRHSAASAAKGTRPYARVADSLASNSKRRTGDKLANTSAACPHKRRCSLPSNSTEAASA